jgi:hypothetical protein
LLYFLTILGDDNCTENLQLLYSYSTLHIMADLEIAIHNHMAEKQEGREEKEEHKEKHEEKKKVGEDEDEDDEERRKKKKKKKRKVTRKSKFKFLLY